MSDLKVPDEKLRMTAGEIGGIWGSLEIAGKTTWDRIFAVARATEDQLYAKCWEEMEVQLGVKRDTILGLMVTIETEQLEHAMDYEALRLVLRKLIAAVESYPDVSWVVADALTAAHQVLDREAGTTKPTHPHDSHADSCSPGLED